MSKPKLVSSFSEFVNEDHAGEGEPTIDGDLKDEAVELDLDESLLDELVELAGSEEAVENAAKLAYEDLVSKAREEVEVDGEDSPENLAIASLVVKLGELGEIEPADADSFLEKHIK